MMYMFGRTKTQKTKITQKIEEPIIEVKSSSQTKQPTEKITLKPEINLKTQKTQLVTIKEYSSVKEQAEKIDKEISEVNCALGQYLRQMDNARCTAEKIERLANVVSKATGKKLPKENPNQLEINGLEIIMDATPIHELAAFEIVARSLQQQLLSLQKIKESIGLLIPLYEIADIKCKVLEKEGIPEQILLDL